MIFIRPNPAFYNANFHQSPGDPATLSTKAAACRAAFGCNRPCERPASMKESNAGVHLVEKTPLHRDESAEKAVISLDVAGYTPDQLKIEVDNHVLTISGSRTNALGDTFVIRRRLALQHDVYDEDNVTANLENTVLRVSISKKPAPTSRKIPITLVSSSRPSTGHSDNDDAKSSLSNQTDEKNEEVVSVETVEDNEDEQDNDDAAALASSPHTSNDEQSNKHSDDAWEQVVNA